MGRRRAPDGQPAAIARRAHARGVRRALEPGAQGLLPERLVGRYRQAVVLKRPARVVADLRGAFLLRIRRRLVPATRGHLRDGLGRLHAQNLRRQTTVQHPHHTGARVRDLELRLEQVQRLRRRNRVGGQDGQAVGYSIAPNRTRDHRRASVRGATGAMRPVERTRGVHVQL